MAATATATPASPVHHAKAPTAADPAAPIAKKPVGRPVDPNKPAKPVKEKAPKPEKINHPLVGSKDAGVYPFKETPTDFDFATMKPLGVKQFASTVAFKEFTAKLYEFRGNQLLERSKKILAKAQAEKSFGDPKLAKSAKKLSTLAVTIAKLRGVLKAGGSSDEEINALMSGNEAMPKVDIGTSAVTPAPAPVVAPAIAPQ